MISAVNIALTWIFSIFFAPFSGANPWLGMASISLVAAILVLTIFRFTSNQRAIKATKDKLIAHLLEITLYRDDMRILLRAQGRILKDNLRYLAHALIPLAVTIMPVGIILIQTDLRYGHRPLKVGEQAIVSLKLQANAPINEVLLSPSTGVKVETPPLRMSSVREVAWRIRITNPGIYNLGFEVAGKSFSKKVVAGDRESIVSERRVNSGFWQQLRNPGERPIPNNLPVEWVKIQYPDQTLSLLGWRFHWIWPFFVMTLVFGYALKGPLRVQV